MTARRANRTLATEEEGGGGSRRFEEEEQEEGEGNSQDDDGDDPGERTTWGTSLWEKMNGSNHNINNTENEMDPFFSSAVASRENHDVNENDPFSSSTVVASNRDEVIPPRSGKEEQREVMEIRRMRWMDHEGDAGYYTGTVNCQTSLPDGDGIMEYEDGVKVEGRWSEGFVESRGGEGGEEDYAQGEMDGLAPLGDVPERRWALSTVQETSFRNSVNGSCYDGASLRRIIAANNANGADVVPMEGGGGQELVGRSAASSSQRRLDDDPPPPPEEKEEEGEFVSPPRGKTSRRRSSGGSAGSSSRRDAIDGSTRSRRSGMRRRSSGRDAAVDNGSDRAEGGGKTGRLVRTSSGRSSTGGSCKDLGSGRNSGKMIRSSSGRSSAGGSCKDLGSGRNSGKSGRRRSGGGGGSAGSSSRFDADGSNTSRRSGMTRRRRRRRSSGKVNANANARHDATVDGSDRTESSNRTGCFSTTSLLGMANTPAPPSSSLGARSDVHTDDEEEDDDGDAAGGLSSSSIHQKTGRLRKRLFKRGSATSDVREGGKEKKEPEEEEDAVVVDDSDSDTADSPSKQRSSVIESRFNKRRDHRLRESDHSMNFAQIRVRVRSLTQGKEDDEDEEIGDDDNDDNGTDDEGKKKKKRRRRRKACLAFWCFVLGCLAAAAAVVCWLLLFRPYDDAGPGETSTVADESPAVNVSNPPRDVDLQATTPTLWNDETNDVTCAPLLIRVTTDEYGNETSWELFRLSEERSASLTSSTSSAAVERRKRLRHHSPAPRADTGRRRASEAASPSQTLVLRSKPYPYIDVSDPAYAENVTVAYESSACLPAGYYEFVMRDANGDGLCCRYGRGSYGLYLPGGTGREVYASAGQFAEEEVTGFEVTEEDVEAAASDGGLTGSLLPPASSPTESPRPVPSGVKTMSTFSGADLLPTTAGSSHGLLFDIRIRSNVSSLTIVGMDILVEATRSVEYEIWTKYGSWRQDVNETDVDPGFRLVSNGTVRGAGPSDLSTIPLEGFRDVTVGGGATQAFWVTLKERGLLFQNYVHRMRRSDGGETMTLASLPEFEVFYGSAILHYPLESADRGRDPHGRMGFLGQFFYMESTEEAFSPHFSPAPIIESNVSSTSEPTAGETSTQPLGSLIPTASLPLTTYPSASLEPSASPVPSSNVTFLWTPVVEGDAPSGAPTTVKFNGNFSSPAVPAELHSNISTNTNNATTPTLPFANATATPSSNNQPPDTLTNTSNITATPTLSVSLQPSGVTSLSTTQPSAIQPAPDSSTLPTNQSLAGTATSSRQPLEGPSTTPFPTTQLPSYPPTIQPQTEISKNAIDVAPPASSQVNSILNVAVDDFVTNFPSVPKNIPIPSAPSNLIFSSTQLPTIQLTTMKSTNTSDFAKPASPAANVTNNLVLNKPLSLPVTSPTQSYTFSSAPSLSDSYNMDSVLNSPSYSSVPTTFSPTTSPSATHMPSVSSMPTFDPLLGFEKSIIIEGIHPSSQYGFSSSTSDDGSILAVGAIDALNENGDATGAVYLYSLDDFANSVVLSTGSDATMPRPFEILYGQSIDDEFGSAVAFSSDGTRLVVGSRNENAQTGAARIYQIQILDYSVILTHEIPGRNDTERAGWSVAISGDGNIVAIGAAKGGPEGGGSVTTYNVSTSVPFGGIVEGQTGDVTGFSVALSQDGSFMAIGSPKAEEPPLTNSGKASVYAIEGNIWELRYEVYGERNSILDGTSVRLSRDGSILVVGGRGYSYKVGEKLKRLAGRCRIFERKENEYELLHTIMGTKGREGLGSSAAVSEDGNIVACGGPGGSWHLNRDTTGLVRLWNRLTTAEKVIWPQRFAEKSSFGSAVSLSSDGKLLFVGASTSVGSDETSPGGMHLFDTEW